MRIQSKLVYDEYLMPSSMAYTKDTLNDFLGQYDQISIQAVVDQSSLAGILTLQIEHSADGLNYVNKGFPAITGWGTGPGLGSFAEFATTVLSGVDQGLLPSLGFVRFKLNHTSGRGIHLKVHVTMRDQSCAPAAGSSTMSESSAPAQGGVIIKPRK